MRSAAVACNLFSEEYESCEERTLRLLEGRRLKFDLTTNVLAAPRKKKSKGDRPSLILCHLNPDKEASFGISGPESRCRNAYRVFLIAFGIR